MTGIVRASIAVLAASAAVMIGTPAVQAAITPTEGASFTAEVASFSVTCSEFSSHANACLVWPVVRDATVTWGDKAAASPGTLSSPTQSSPSANTRQYTVTATHTYAETGSYTITTTVTTDSDGTATIGPAGTPTSAVVGNQPLRSPGGTPVSASTGVLFSGRVATFTDDNASGKASDDAATITWGDGATSAGTVIAVSGQTYQVTASHTYAAKGTYPVGVTVVNGGQAFTMPAETATVSDPPLTPASVSFSASQGTRFSGPVARFTDPNTLATAGSFTATITWGDGSDQTVGAVSAAPGDGFQVTGGHTYSTAGAATVTVKVSFGSDPPTTITSIAQITAAKSNSPSTGPTINAPTLTVGGGMSIRHLSAAGATATMDITCAKTAARACAGSLAATSPSPARARPATPILHNPTVAHTSFHVGQGQTRRVKLTLNRAGVRRLRASYQLHVTVALTGTATRTFAVTYAYPKIRTLITYSATFKPICCAPEPVSDLVFSNIPRRAHLTMVCRRGACTPHARSFYAHGTILGLGRSVVIVTLAPHATVDFEATKPGDVGVVVEVSNPGSGPPTNLTLCLPPWAHHPVTCPSGGSGD